MNIQNISKNDREVTVTLSSDELVKLCNVLYYARDKYDGDNLYHEIKSDLMIARDIVSMEILMIRLFLKL